MRGLLGRLLSRFRRRLDRTFSSRLFGAVLFGGALGKVVEWLITIHVRGWTPERATFLAAWATAAVVLLVLAVVWNPLERRLQGDDDPGGSEGA